MDDPTAERSNGPITASIEVEVMDETNCQKVLNMWCCCFFKWRKMKTIECHKGLDTDISWGVIYMFICCLVIKIISIVTTYIVKDSLLKQKRHTFIFHFVVVLHSFPHPLFNFVEALESCQTWVLSHPWMEWMKKCIDEHSSKGKKYRCPNVN